MGGPEITLTDLATALVNKEFVYYYQPKVSMITGEVCGAEALIRWHKPDGSIIPPYQFIPLAESIGFISEITLAMFEKLIVDVTIIHDVSPNLSISFNASAKDFCDSRLTDKIREAVENQSVEPKKIEVELTETVMMEEDESIKGHLLLLNELGVSLAMDDFGTGFSTIDTLSKWPFTTLKIDQGVVDRMQSSDKDLTIVQSSIRMAHQLGLEIVAEGIETEEVYLILQNAGCKIAQGYLFSKPIPLMDFLKYIKSGTHWPSLPAGMVHMAQLDHIQWRKEIIDGACFLCTDKSGRRFVRGNPNLEPQQCMFGKWYYSAGRTFKGVEAYDLIEQPHNRLHELGRKILERARQNGPKDELVPMIRELTSISNEVISLLQRLEGEMVMTSNPFEPQ